MILKLAKSSSKELLNALLSWFVLETEKILCMDLYAFTLIYMYIFGFIWMYMVIEQCLIEYANCNTVDSRSSLKGVAIGVRGSTPNIPIQLVGYIENIQGSTARFATATLRPD